MSKAQATKAKATKAAPKKASPQPLPDFVIQAGLSEGEGTKPDNTSDGVKPGDVLDSDNATPGNDADVTLRQAQDDKHSKEMHESMKPYVEAYKDHGKFLVSSDGQVFLMSHEQDARAHQKSLDPKKELTIYSV